MNLLLYLITGYVLAELRLYKKLKTDLDGEIKLYVVITATLCVDIGQISILQNGFEQSSRQHLMCINLLEQAQHMSGNVPLI